MSGALVDLSDATFDAQTAQGVVLVDFWAPWCGPCKMQTPILEKLAPTVAGKAVIAKVNVDENPSIAARFGIRSIPTLILLQNGAVKQQFVGVQPAPKLQAAIEAL